MKLLSRVSSKKSKNKSDSDKPLCKYHSYESFPARTFFEVLDTKNYQLMRPKPSVKTEDLERIFLDVYEEHFKKINNTDAVRFIELRNKITQFSALQLMIKQVLAFVWTDMLQHNWTDPRVIEERNRVISALNEYLANPISLGIEFIDELERVLNQEIGALEDEINFAQSEIDILRKEDNQAIFDFYSEIAVLEDVHGRTLDERMMLPKYDQIKLLAIKKNERAKQQAMMKK